MIHLPNVYNRYNKYIYVNGEWEILSSEIASIIIDSIMSTTSENPVQNKVITAALNDRATRAELGYLELSITGIESILDEHTDEIEELQDAMAVAGVIDDTHVTSNTTYSSHKIVELFGDVGTAIDRINGEVI